MKKFIVKLFLFLLPPVMLLLFPFILLFQAGELVFPSKIISLAVTENKNVLYGPAYGGYTKALKVEATLAYKPEVLALGDSRVLQFRKQFFNPNVSFYNAGLAVSNLPDFKTFLNLIPTNFQPKVLIIDINQQLFNEHTYVPFDQGGKKFMSAPGLNEQVNIFITSWTHVYKHLFEGKFTVGQIFKKQQKNNKLLGLEAIVQLKGFRNDGSYYDGAYVLGRSPMPAGYDFVAAKEWIDTGANSFAYGQEVSTKAVEELNSFLSECQKRDIYVIGFFAPFPHQVFSQIKENGQYGYFFKLPNIIKPLFEKYKFEFYDFSDLQQLGANDDEVTDAAHASEKAYLRLHLKMLESGSKLNDYSNKELLVKELNNSTSSLDVFPDGFAN